MSFLFFRTFERLLWISAFDSFPAFVITHLFAMFWFTANEDAPADVYSWYMAQAYGYYAAVWSVSGLIVAGSKEHSVRRNWSRFSFLVTLFWFPFFLFALWDSRKHQSWILMAGGVLRIAQCHDYYYYGFGDPKLVGGVVPVVRTP